MAFFLRNNRKQNIAKPPVKFSVVLFLWREKSAAKTGANEIWELELLDGRNENRTATNEGVFYSRMEWSKKQLKFTVRAKLEEQISTDFIVRRTNRNKIGNEFLLPTGMNKYEQMNRFARQYFLEEVVSSSRQI